MSGNLARFDETVNGTKIPALTSLRFVAAFMIVLHHSQGHFGISEQAFQPWPLDHGVAFFFVLSGFILTYTYPNVVNTGCVRFIAYRVARLGPTHWLAFAVLLVLSPGVSAGLTGPMLPVTVALNLLMLQAWVPVHDIATSFNGPAWSISTEFGFYVAFLLLSINWRATWHWKYIGVWCVLLLGSAVSDRFSLATMADNGWNVTAFELFYYNPAFRLVEFTTGMCLALLWRFTRERWRPGIASATAVEVGALALLVVLLSQTSALYSLMVRPGLIGPSLGIWLAHGGLSLVGLGAVVFVFALSNGYIARVMSLPTLVALGEMSYAMYLLHQMFIFYYDHYSRAFMWLPGWLTYAMFWAFLLLSSLLIWRWIERPSRIGVRRLAERFLDGVRMTPTAVPSAGRRPRSFRLAPMAELAGFGLLVGFFTYAIFWRPNIEDVGGGETAEVRAATPASLREVQFGDAFLLKGVRAAHSVDGLTLEFVWQTLRPLNLSYTNAVHLLDSNAQLVGQMDYPQDTAHSSVAEGRMWKDVLTVSEERLKGVTALGLGVYPTPEPTLLLIDRGPRDWDNHRLLLELNQLEAPRYPDGTFVMGQGPGIYVVEAAEKRVFSNMEVFKTSGGLEDLSNVLHLSPGDLAAIPEGPVIDGVAGAR